MEIIHNREEKTFETYREELRSYARYRVFAGELSVVTTQVPSPLSGQGIAAALMKATYDYAIENGLKPSASCSYAQVWLARHPEYMSIKI